MTEKEFNASLRKTNTIWNNKGFNQQHVIGSMMGLLKEFNPASPEEFEKMYYKSGETRKRKIDQKYHKDVDYDLNNPCDILNQIAKSGLDKNLIDVNFNLGRTEKFIENLAKEFSDVANIDHDLALKQVKHRLFYETYKGKEIEDYVFAKIKDKYNLNFRLSTPQEDSEYAVDLVGEKNGKVVVGVQVKPCSYNHRSDAQHSINKNKNESFNKKYGSSVVYAFYNDFKNGLRVLMSHKDEKVLRNLSLQED